MSYRDRTLHSVSCQTFCIIPLHSWCLYISDTFPIYIIVSLRQLTFAVDILWVLWVSIHLSAIVMPTARHTGCKGKRHHCFPFPGQGFCCLYPVSCLLCIVMSGSVCAFFYFLYLICLGSLCCSDKLQGSYFSHLVRLCLNLYFSSNERKKYMQGSCHSMKCFQT